MTAPAAVAVGAGIVSDYLRVAYRRALAAQDPALVQLWFDATVLDRYLGDSAYQVIRTNTAARVRRQGGWSLDFGVAPDGTLHAAWHALAHALPDGERAHWADHGAEGGDVSENFLRMLLAPGSCFDDGEVRSWQ